MIVFLNLKEIFDNRNLGYFSYKNKAENYHVVGTAMFYIFYI